MKKRRLAVFDIDGTVFRSSLLRELLESLIIFGILPYKAQIYYMEYYIKWLDRKGPYHKYQKAVIKSYQKYIKGINKNLVHETSVNVLNFHRYRIYRYTKHMISDLKKKGYYLVAISGSPQDIVDSFAKNIGFDLVYGRVFELDKKNKFTGKVLNQKEIERKDVILKKIFLSNKELTLKDSIGVGDTDLDIPFLKLVEHPIAFNPNKKLYNYSKKNKWKIVIERKDIIIKQ